MKKIELSIKEFVVFILRKWPVVLAFMLVFGMLFGVLGEAPHQQQMKNRQAEYEAAMEAYEITVADYEKALKDYSKAVEQQKADYEKALKDYSKAVEQRKADYEKALKDYPKAVEQQKADYEKALKDYSKAVEQQKADYEKALEEYENAPELNAIRLSELIKERDEVKAYLEDSFLMNIDPDNKQVASITIQITGDDGESINYNVVRQINERYFALAVDAPLQTLFSDFSLKEYENKYLNEMYGVSKGTFDLLTITAFGNKDINAGKCVQAVYDYLLSKQEAVTEGSGLKHSISIISMQDKQVIDSALKTQQIKQKQQMDAIETQIEALETLVLEKPEEPEALQPPEEPEALQPPEEPEALQPPEEPEPLAEPAKPEEPDAPAITSYSLISQIPYGIAIGLAVSILMISLLYILRLPVQLPEQMHRQLGIAYLGGIKKRSIVLNPGAKLAGSLRLLEEGKAIEFIAANINEALGERRKILVTGSAPEEAIEAFTKSMEKVFNWEDVSFNFAKDVNTDAEAVVILSDADAVLLVERLNHSRLRKVNQMKDRIDMSGKNILGYVLV